MSVQFFEFKSGVKIKTAHGLPHIWRMIEIAVETAPALEDDTLVITEAWRLPRHPDDAHSWCNAFDVRVRTILIPRKVSDSTTTHLYAARKAEAWRWVARIRKSLHDPRYQFDVHGEGSNIHIHMEFDPR